MLGYSYLGIVLGSSYLGIIDTRRWVSMILGYWYLGIIATTFWLSLILVSGSIVDNYCRYWYLGIIDTRVGYLRFCMQYVKMIFGWLTHKTSQAPQFFFTGEAHMYPASFNLCSSSLKSLETKFNASKPHLNWWLSSGHTLLAPHKEASNSFRSPRRSPGDTPWALLLPP